MFDFIPFTAATRRELKEQGYSKLIVFSSLTAIAMKEPSLGIINLTAIGVKSGQPLYGAYYYGVPEIATYPNQRTPVGSIQRTPSVLTEALPLLAEQSLSPSTSFGKDYFKTFCDTHFPEIVITKMHDPGYDIYYKNETSTLVKCANDSYPDFADETDNTHRRRCGWGSCSIL